MRTALAVLTVPAVLAACTFPDVDYAGDTGGGEAGSAPTCAVPSMCASDALSCADEAQHDDESCRKPCQSNSACLASCDAVRQSALGSCAAACESCRGPMCSAQPTNCKALVGL